MCNIFVYLTIFCFATFIQVAPKLTQFLDGQANIPSLSDFITYRSWVLFHLIQRGTGWLATHPARWPADAEYIFIAAVARDILVVNDCAERNIRAITEYVRFTRNVNGMLDDIVLVGEDQRSLVPNLNRENLLHA